MPRKLRARLRNKPARKKSNSEPLAEGIIVPLDKQGHRIWSSMSDDELVEHAEKFIEKKGLKNRFGLKKKDSGLYDILRRRRLLDGLEFELKKRVVRNWAFMSDDELVEHAENFMREKKIKSRAGLRKKDCGVYETLRRRKLIDKIEFEEVRRDWASMSDDKFVDYVKNFMKENKIKNRTGLQREAGGLYQALWKRKLLDRLEFESDERAWSKYSNDELVDFTRKVIEEKGIKNRSGLAKEASGLYQALRKRKLLGRLGFEKKFRNWSNISDDKLVEYAKVFIVTEGIKNRRGLEKEDNGLYQALGRRKLLDKLEFKVERPKCRSWASLSYDKLVDYVKIFIKEKKIKNRTGLKKEDHGLYEALRRRKLLDRVFEDIDKSKEKQAVQDVFDALREFGGS